MSASIGEVIASLREKKGLSQKELASRLSLFGVSVSNQAVSKWENGLTQPSAAQFLALCRILDVRDVLASFTGYSRRTALDFLNDEGRAKVDDYIRVLNASGLYRAASRPSPRSIPVYDVSASAGTGQYLDSAGFELREMPDGVPDSAEFGVRVAGDSMEPRFHDGGIVWVRAQQTIANGEYGIFIYRGESYIKQLGVSDGRPALISVNPAYAPIVIEDELRVLGKVLS